jgi:poly-gamma-glutamate synthase PgsB/CapB
VPRRVAVTGTRGKSGVTRFVAAGLRASGARVLAKTTGSAPVLIFPDGSEREIVRPGRASVREQVRLVALAAELGADTLVAEMMSIGPECLAVESRRILRPGTLALTNVRLDHLDDMGRDRVAIARTLASAVPRGADVFVPDEEAHAAFEDAARRSGAKLHRVAREDRGEGAGGGPALPLGEFEPNRRLARAVLLSLGIDRATADRGLAAAAPDPGNLRISHGLFGRPPRPATCVSLFAANEPESSAAALADVRSRLPLPRRPLVGLLSLREDRGDRTLQWVRAAGDGYFGDFAAVVLAGPQARAALRLVRRAGRGAPPSMTRFSASGAASPEVLMDLVMATVAGEPVVVGLGNFVGLGGSIARYWECRENAHGR